MIKNPCYGKTGNKHHSSKPIKDNIGNLYSSRRELVSSLGISQPTCAKRIKLGIYNYV